MAFLNLDAAELPDEPVELYPLAGMLNVACGGHAGDAASIRRVVAHAGSATISAHLSYPDRAGFGRVSLVLPPEDLTASLHSQLALLDHQLRGRLRHIKLHGALYHDAARSPFLAALVVDAAAASAPGAEWSFVGPASGALRDAVAAQGWRYFPEGFADRGYLPDGALIPRGQPGALIAEPNVCAQQALRLVRQAGVTTVCVHGDSPRALDITRAVHSALLDAGLLDTPEHR